MSISNLPSVYLDDMKKILGNEYEAFLDSSDTGSVDKQWILL